MPSFKIDRTTEDIHRELTAILREVKDPRVKDCLLSLVRVEVTNDLSYCTVYVSTMEGLERSKTAVQGLKSAAGFIRPSCFLRPPIPSSTAPTSPSCSTTWSRNRPGTKPPPARRNKPCWTAPKPLPCCEAGTRFW